MKLHRNATSTPVSRLLLVRWVVFEGWSYAATAQGFGVSARTASDSAMAVGSAFDGLFRTADAGASWIDQVVPASRAMDSEALAGGE